MDRWRSLSLLRAEVVACEFLAAERDTFVHAPAKGKADVDA